MGTATYPTTETAELRLARQIARLFKRRQGIVWELVEAATTRQAGDLTLRDAEGLLVAYARPIGPGRRAR
jgi:hypothetical protein